MIVSIHQPHYIPWLGYFDKIDAADVFVLLDSVQFEKNGWQNRNRIKTTNGWKWLTIPVKHAFGTSIADTVIDNTSHWTNKHFQSLVTNYARAPFFKAYSEYFQVVFSQQWDYLLPITTSMLEFFIRKLDITTSIIKASELGTFSDDPTDRLVEIVSRIGGDIYYAGVGSKGYLDDETFKQAGIKVIFQNYQPVTYTQLYGEFIPGLSIIDTLFNMGEAALSIIRQGRRTYL